MSTRAQTKTASKDELMAKLAEAQKQLESIRMARDAIAGKNLVLAQERDAKRSEFLTRLGVTILRFDNDQVFKNRERVVEAIRASLKTSATEPPLA